MFIEVFLDLNEVSAVVPVDKLLLWDTSSACTTVLPYALYDVVIVSVVVVPTCLASWPPLFDARRELRRITDPGVSIRMRFLGVLMGGVVVAGSASSGLMAGETEGARSPGRDRIGVM